MNIIRDRAVLAREIAGGRIENLYRLQVMNVTEQAQRYSISVSGLKGIALEGPRSVEVPSASAKSVLTGVSVSPDAGEKGSHKIFFDVKTEGDASKAVHEKATFLMP